MSYPKNIRFLLLPAKSLRTVYVLSWVFCLQICTSNAYGTVDQHGLQLNRLQRLAECTDLNRNPYHKPDTVEINSLTSLRSDLGKDLIPTLRTRTRNTGIKRVRDVASQAAAEGRASIPKNHSQSPPQGYTNTYRKNSNELEVPRDEMSFKRHRERLATDALDIVNSALQKEERELTTCLCVSLRNNNGTIKKFSFHSGDQAMPQLMYDEANRKNYDVIQADRSHAEGQMIQFLLNNATEYTHIVGIGCSRLYCPECDVMFGLLLGRNWESISSAVFNTFHSIPVNRSITGGEFGAAANGNTTYQQHIAISGSYYINTYDMQLVDSRVCRLYKLSPLLRGKLELAIAKKIIFAGDRF